MVTDEEASTRSSTALFRAIPGVVGVLVAFITAIVQYAGIDGGTTKHLEGLDSFLGAPAVAVSIVFFSLFVTWYIGESAGARYRHGLYVAAIVVASVGTAYELIAVIFGFSWVAIILLIAALALLVFTIQRCRDTKAADVAPQIARADRPMVFGVFLVIAGLAGLAAAYNLSVDKVTAILFPDQNLNCNVSPLVQCGKNLGSWQGSLFGFPNPLIGLGGFAVVLLIGIAVLAGVRFPRWWWVAFNIGVIGAFAFIVFLFSQSLYILGTLCLWCALTWSVTIPLFWLVTFRSLKSGYFKVSPRATKFFEGAYTWVPLITLVCYLAVLLAYQLQIDLLGSLFR
jgi:uncharacterized membrane protein